MELVLAAGTERAAPKVESEQLADFWLAFHETDHAIAGIAQQSADALQTRLRGSAAGVVVVNG